MEVQTMFDIRWAHKTICRYYYQMGQKGQPHQLPKNIKSLMVSDDVKFILKTIDRRTGREINMSKATAFDEFYNVNGMRPKFQETIEYVERNLPKLEILQLVS